MGVHGLLLLLLLLLNHHRSLSQTDQGETRLLMT